MNTAGADGEPLQIVATKSTPLWESLCRAYRVLGFDSAVGGDEVFRDFVLARIIEPTSKIDSLRVLAENWNRAGRLPHSHAASTDVR